MDLKDSSEKCSFKNRLIIFDGPKASGKGFYLKAVAPILKEKGYVIFNNRGRDSSEKLQYYHKKFSPMFYDINNDYKMHCYKGLEYLQLMNIYQQQINCVLDRSYISEFVYGKIHRGYEFPYHELDEMVADLFDYRIFIFLPSLGELTKRQQERDGKIEDNIKHVINRFKFYSASTRLNVKIFNTIDPDLTIDSITAQI